MSRQPNITEGKSRTGSNIQKFFFKSYKSNIDVLQLSLVVKQFEQHFLVESCGCYIYMYLLVFLSSTDSLVTIHTKTTFQIQCLSTKQSRNLLFFCSEALFQCKEQGTKV